MSCPSCEHHVEKALRDTSAREVEADFRRGEVMLTTNTPPDHAGMAEAVRQAGYTPSTIEPVALPASQNEDLVEYRLPVTGMTCADCERHVTEALRGVGASEVEANFRRAESRFRAPRTLDPAVLAAALANTPYRTGTLEQVASGPAPTPGNGRPGAGDRYDLLGPTRFPG